MKNLQIHKMLPEKAPEVSAKLKEVFTSHIAPECTDLGCESFARYITPENLLARTCKDCEVWLLKHEDEIAALGEIVPPAHITLLFVLPEHQGTGAGRLLFRHLLNRVLEKSDDIAELKITVNSVPGAKGFYQSLGFKPTGEQQYIEGIPSIPMVLEVR